MIRSIAGILSAPVHHHQRHEYDGATIEESADRPLAVSSRPVASTLAVIVMLAGAFVLAPPALGKRPWVSEYDLEPSLRSAALVVAVRVESVSPVQVVYGGKGTQTIYQYTFTPIRVLKGVYSRPELLMTSTDLQPYNYAFDPRDIQSGQQRLLILGRSNVGYYGIRSGSTADELFPPVSGPTDALLSASEALLAQQELHDRLEIVSRLTRDLRGAEGRGAVALLAALDRRSDIAAQHTPAFQAVAHQLVANEAFVREAAANVLGNLLDADYLNNQPVRESSVTALVASLEKPTTLLKARVAAVRALASATDAVRANEDRRYLEAAVVAIAAIRKADRADQLLDIYRNSNDPDWTQAAVRALGLLGHEPFKDELRMLTRDLSHPLAPPALQARADLGDTQVLGLLPAALMSRNEAVVIAAARAAATLLPQQENEPTQAATDIRRALAAFASDPEAALAVRRYALEGLTAAEDQQLDRILVAMARDSRLEQTELLDRVRELMRERKVAI